MSGQLQSLLPIAVLVGVFWFLIIRPQQQRAKKQRAMIEELQPGSEIVTIGGIYATVVATGERIRVRVVDGSEFELATQAIGQVLPPREDAADVDGVVADDEAPEPIDVVDDDAPGGEESTQDA